MFGSLTRRFPLGKYDTYKGSTLSLRFSIFSISRFTGKYDTYKGSTHVVIPALVINASMGKYDTYKGSTHLKPLHCYNQIHAGKYDTYKGSTPRLVICLYPGLAAWEI